MSVSVDFLKDIQLRGWPIERVNPDDVVVSCPNAGCSVRVRLKTATVIPESCSANGAAREQTVKFFDDARVFLRGKREDLRLTIKDVEFVAGMADDFLAKFEKDRPSKYPNVQTFIEWAESLGYDVVLRPAPLPARALRVLAETRHLLTPREQMISQHRARREASGQSSSA